MVKKTLGHLNLKFVLEPGRMIVGGAAVKQALEDNLKAAARAAANKSKPLTI